MEEKERDRGTKTRGSNETLSTRDREREGERRMKTCVDNECLRRCARKRGIVCFLVNGKLKSVGAESKRGTCTAIATRGIGYLAIPMQPAQLVCTDSRYRAAAFISRLSLCNAPVKIILAAKILCQKGSENGARARSRKYKRLHSIGEQRYRASIAFNGFIHGPMELATWLLFTLPVADAVHALRSLGDR